MLALSILTITRGVVESAKFAARDACVGATSPTAATYLYTAAPPESSMNRNIPAHKRSLRNEVLHRLQILHPAKSMVAVRYVPPQRRARHNRASNDRADGEEFSRSLRRVGCAMGGSPATATETSWLLGAAVRTYSNRVRKAMSHTLITAVLAMANSPIRHYIAPGLTSSLIGGPQHGKVRLFCSERETREWVTPHSHRFDFTCLVLRGWAENIIFTRQWGADGADLYSAGTLKRNEAFGQYEFTPSTEACAYVESSKTYNEGDVYAMTHEQIHSIRFSRDAMVLFFEGPEVTESSLVLEPWSSGKRVPTFETRPWMFERDTDPTGGSGA